MKYLKSILNTMKGNAQMNSSNKIARHPKDIKFLDCLVNPKYTKIWKLRVKIMEPTTANIKIDVGRTVFSNSFSPCMIYTVLGTEGMEIRRMPIETTITISIILKVIF